MPYEYLEETATADIAFRAWGESVEETFKASADAVMNVMIEDLDSIRMEQRKELEFEGEELDLLLLDLLQEIIYFKDAERLLLLVKDIRIRKTAGHKNMEVIAEGEALNPERHRQRADVKAVTLHHFRLGPTETGWEARIILDI